MGLFKSKKKTSPFSSGDTRKTLHKNLEFTAAEQYKLLRTNLNFTIPEDENCPVIGITSSMRGEGKSTTAINLSYVLAEKGKRVILIDGDLRLPSVAKKMEIKSSPGLTNLLMSKEAYIKDFQSDLLSNLYILPAGDIPPNPSELLSSRRMEIFLEKLKESFDYIVIDLPPVNLVSDAMSISKLITGLVVVIREEYTEKKELEHCFRQLRLSNTNVLGFVMNESRNSNGAYKKYGKYKYYRYGRNHQKEQSLD